MKIPVIVETDVTFTQYVNVFNRAGCPVILGDAGNGYDWVKNQAPAITLTTGFPYIGTFAVTLTV